MTDQIPITTTNGTKRKRSVIACAGCHARKVRCNVALQGVPCSNCVQDAVNCQIYQRKIGIPGQGALKQRRENEQSSPTTTNGSSHMTNEDHSYGVTPSPAAANATAPPLIRKASSIAQGGIMPQEIAQTNQGTDSGNGYEDQHQYPHSSTQAHTLDLQSITAYGRQKSAGNQQYIKEVEPYFAGESEGLEFLFDQCAPDRPVKGLHYVTPRKTYRYKRNITNRGLHYGIEHKHPLPPLQIQQELMRCFCHYVYPLLPVVDIKEVLEAFEQDSAHISPLLSWSIFFAALNFIDKDLLRAHRLPPRKLLKEQYYQNAKTLWDSQCEPDKTVLMSSCILLSMLYTDLDDRDGSWFWIGTATSLAQTIGLHRASNYASIPTCPFPKRKRLLWRRIWWCCYYREAWLAQGFGRPMRVNIQDCDEAMPQTNEVLEELRDLPAHLFDKYLPPDIAILVDLWIILVHLCIELGEVLMTHYRPRSSVPDPLAVREQEARIVELRHRIPGSSSATVAVVLIHLCHLELYFNNVLIVLYRSLIAWSPDKLPSQDHVSFRRECISKAKTTAADTTNILNKLMLLNAIDKSPSMFMSTTMTAMQILVFEMRNATGLDRSYAAHQIGLHQLVLGELRRTYWTADLQFNLFSEVLKTLHGNEPCEHGVPTRTPANEKLAEKEDSNNGHQEPNGLVLFEGEQGLAAHHALDDFFGMFNPFMGLPTYGDDLSTSVDWDLSPPASLNMPGLTGQLEG